MATLHIVSHTHWDREWHQPFQVFRFRLVALVDQVVELLENDPGYRFFTLDGQTIILDDYLEVRPEMAERIQALIEGGRLLVGPWYVLPDEFLEGPEALVRNLLFGRRGCRRFTTQPQPMERIAYLPDSFGHIGQLPQIAAGFRMGAVCIWRGIGEAPCEFRWAAPDGTEALVLHLRDSYSNGAWLAGGDDPVGFIQDLAAQRDGLRPHAATDHLLVMQGTDHMPPRTDLPARVEAARAALGDTVLHSTLPAYAAAVRDGLGAKGLAGLPLRRGEMRSPERAHLLPAVLSARMWIKQWNARCESLLTRWAEPFGVLAEQVTGYTGHRGFTREAWTWLLQNHPHDSICGCSIDQVHAEMRTRFAWAEQIGEQVTDDSLARIARLVDTQTGPRETADAGQVLVFNPSPFVRAGRVRARIAPAPLGTWHLVDDEGQEAPHEALGRAWREVAVLALGRDALAEWLARVRAARGLAFGPLYVQELGIERARGSARLEVVVSTARSPALAPLLARVEELLADPEIESFQLRVVEDTGLEVEMLACDVPPLGYRRYLVVLRDRDAAARGGQTRSSEPQAAWPGAGSALAIENEFLVVQAQPTTGTLTITDKETGLVVRGANQFVDGGDRGDTYTYCPPERDILIDGPAALPTVHRSEDRLGATLEIGLLYRVPRSLTDGDRSARSASWVDLPITTRVSLTRGVRRVDFETTVHNTVEDHRLRVHFPTPIVTDRSWAEGHFDVVERPVALPEATPAWAEQPVGTHPQLGFVDVSDGAHGVMVLNRGLPEYEVLAAGGPEELGWGKAAKAATTRGGGRADALSTLRAAAASARGRGAAEAATTRGRQTAARGVTVALTLLRGVGWLSRGDLRNRAGGAGPEVPVPEAQCPGEHTFHYGLVLHQGGYLGAVGSAQGAALQEAHAFGAPLRATSTTTHAGPLPPALSFVEVSPAAVVLSTVKAPEEGRGLIVRVYNSAPDPVQAWVTLWREFEEAVLVRLDEGPALVSLGRNTDTVTLPLRPREIATLRFAWEAGGEVGGG